MKIVERPVWKWTLVERPPMSQRSHIAISGSTAIWPCSVACSEPSRTSGGSAAGEPVGQHVPERLGDEVLLGQLEGDDVDRLLVGDRDPLEGDHLLGHRDLAEVELDARDLALLARSVRCRSRSPFSAACTSRRRRWRRSPAARRRRAARPRRSARGAGRRRRDGSVVKARSASTSPSISPESRSITATESAEAERRAIRLATNSLRRGSSLPPAAAQLPGRDQPLGPLAPAAARRSPSSSSVSGSS